MKLLRKVLATGIASMLMCCMAAGFVGCNQDKDRREEVTLILTQINEETREKRETYEMSRSDNYKELSWTFDDQTYIFDVEAKRSDGLILSFTREDKLWVAYNYQSFDNHSFPEYLTPKNGPVYHIYAPGIYQVSIEIPFTHHFIKPYDIRLKK